MSMGVAFFWGMGPDSLTLGKCLQHPHFVWPALKAWLQYTPRFVMHANHSVLDSLVHAL